MGQQTSTSHLSSNFKRLADIFEGWLAEETGRRREPLAKLSEIALLGAGKRVRPVLCLATAEALGFRPESVREYALALEFLHTSSLVHDDLPALDNDDFRRGQPTLHKHIGEALAILSGDLLIVEAFGLLARARPERAAEVNRQWFEIFAEAAVDLCEGQTLDLVMMDRVQVPAALSPSGQHKSSETLEIVCMKKTAALFRAAVLGPTALLSEDLRSKTAAALREYAQQLGLLFQITDDLLDSGDESADSSFSYASELGVKGAEQEADRALLRAQNALAALSADSWFLSDFAISIRHRKH